MKLRLTMRYAFIVGVILITFVVPVAIWSFYYHIGSELDADFNALQDELEQPVLPEWFERLQMGMLTTKAATIEPYSHRDIKRFALYTVSATEQGDVVDEIPLFSTYFWYDDSLNWAMNGKLTTSDRLWYNKDQGQFYYLRIHKQRIRQQDYVIAVAISVTTAIEILFSVLVALPIALLLSSLGGYWLVDRALQPLRDITRKVEHLNAEQIVTHLAVPNPKDEMGQLAQALNQSLDRIDQSFQRLKNFTADAAHQLRTPLTIMHHVGELSLQKTLTATQYKESIGSLLEESYKLQQVIDTLLLLTQRDSGNVVQSPIQFDDIAVLVREIVDLLQVMADEKQQTLQITNRDKVSVPVYMDQHLLEQGLINIIHNAILYTPDGGKITIDCAYNMDAKTQQAQSSITIADNGAGISCDDAEHIFNRFYRGSVPHLSSPSGTGLGLAVAQQAIELAGGDVQLLNAGEQGAVFQVRCRCYPATPC